jgi:hypothetical protein
MLDKKSKQLTKEGIRKLLLSSLGQEDLEKIVKAKGCWWDLQKEAVKKLTNQETLYHLVKNSTSFEVSETATGCLKSQKYLEKIAKGEDQDQKPPYKFRRCLREIAINKLKQQKTERIRRILVDLAKNDDFREICMHSLSCLDDPRDIIEVAKSAWDEGVVEKAIGMIKFPEIIVEAIKKTRPSRDDKFLWRAFRKIEGDAKLLQDIWKNAQHEEVRDKARYELLHTHPLFMNLQIIEEITGKNLSSLFKKKK